MAHFRAGTCRYTVSVVYGMSQMFDLEITTRPPDFSLELERNIIEQRETKKRRRLGCEVANCM